MKIKVIGIGIVAIIVLVAVTLLVIGSSGYWEETFSGEGLEGAIGFTTLIHFADGTTENTKMLYSQNPFEIWNKFGEEKEIDSISFILTAKASGRGHTTVDVQEKSGFDVFFCDKIMVLSPINGEPPLFEGILSHQSVIETSFPADGQWHDLVQATIGSDALNQYIESNVDPSYLTDDFISFINIIYTDADIVEIKSDVMSEWMTVDLPKETDQGFMLHYLPPYGTLNWESALTEV